KVLLATEHCAARLQGGLAVVAHRVAVARGRHRQPHALAVDSHGNEVRLRPRKPGAAPGAVRGWILRPGVDHGASLGSGTPACFSAASYASGMVRPQTWHRCLPSGILRTSV